MREVVLPSGNKLEVSPAPFKDAKRLFQAVGGDFLKINLGEGDAELIDLLKNAICIGVSSPAIEAALEPCLKRCIYKGVKITPDTWEPVEAREDYLDVCVEVARENVGPFTKSLFAQFKVLSGAVGKVLQSVSPTIPKGSSSISDLKTPDSVA